MPSQHRSSPLSPRGSSGRSTRVDTLLRAQRTNQFSHVNRPMVGRPIKDHGPQGEARPDRRGETRPPRETPPRSYQYSHRLVPESGRPRRNEKPHLKASQSDEEPPAQAPSFASLFQSMAPLGNRIASWGFRTPSAPTPRALAASLQVATGHETGSPNPPGVFTP